MKYFGIILAVACASVSAANDLPDLPGWRVAWRDEFDGASLDTDLWVPLDRRDSFNNEKQYYHPNQVAVVNGELRLTAINVPRSGKAYQSGLVTSRDLFGVGRFEARIDLPTSQGMWPAFWLNANHVQWPLGGEIDILENRGSQPTLTSSAYHWQTNPGPCCDQHEFVYGEYSATAGGQPVNFHAGFHTYAVEWTESLLRFFVDDNLHFQVIESPSQPIIETAKNIILNLAVGGDFGGDPNSSTVWPQTMRVDYVRYWQRDERLPGDYNGDGTVDVSDYSLWRDQLGQSGIGLSADGSGNGSVGVSDYLLWSREYGVSASLGFARVVVAPEPSSPLLTLIAFIYMLLRRRAVVR